ETLDEEMKVTVIATGFRYAVEQQEPLPASAARPVVTSAGAVRYTTPPAGATSGQNVTPPAPEPPAPEPKERIPFYRRMVATSDRGGEPGGFGPSWWAVDDYDIPTVLRKQMD